jgi:hypothetical protein
MTLKQFCADQNYCYLLITVRFFEPLVPFQTLKGLETWCTENEMDLNVTECKVISFGTSRTKILCSYEINGTMVERVSFIRDLGVIVEGKITRPNFLSHQFFNFTKTFCFDNFTN